MASIDSNDTDEVIQLVKNRYSILKAIQEGILEKRVLTDVLNVSRSTVNRAVQELDNAGMLSVEGTDYQLTAFGTLIQDEYRHFRDTTENITDAKPVLKSIPAVSTPPIHLLQDTTIIESTEFSPEQPWIRVIEKWADSATINLVLPRISRSMVQTLLEHRDQALTVNLWLHKRTFDAFQAEAPCSFETLEQSSTTHIGIIPNQPKYGVGTASHGAVVLFAYGSGGRIRAALISEGRRQYNWGEKQIKEFTKRG